MTAADLLDPADELPDILADGTLSVAGAEAFSGLGRTTLYELMLGGKLAYTKVGARRLIPKRALLALLAEQLTSVDVTAK